MHTDQKWLENDLYAEALPDDDLGPAIDQRIVAALLLVIQLLADATQSKPVCCAKTKGSQRISAYPIANSSNQMRSTSAFHGFSAVTARPLAQPPIRAD